MKDIIPTGELFLDTDSDLKATKGTDFILNTIVTADGRGKVSINCYGNESVYSALLHTSGNTALLGSCTDNARNRIIMFFTDDSNDSIQYYEPFTGASGVVISGRDILNFNVNYPIDDPKVVGDLLYWTDGYNEPKKANYIRAYNWTNGGHPEYSYYAINQNVLNAYKRPGRPFVVDAITSGTDILRGKSYQWAYRKVFVDGEKSVLSDFTTLYFTDTLSYPNGEMKTGEGVYQYQLNASLDFTNNDLIYFLEIYVRDNEISDWYLYDSIDQPDQSFSYLFDDKNMRIQADQEDLARPYDFMPHLAKHQELIEKNRIIYANITEGFDLTPVDVDTEVIYTIAPLQDVNSNSYSIGNTDTVIYIKFDNYPIDVLYGIQLMKVLKTTSFIGTSNNHEISVTASIYNSLPIGNSIYSADGVGVIRNKYITGSSYIIVLDISMTSGTFTFQLGTTSYVDVRYLAKSTDTATTILNNLANKLSIKGISSTVVSRTGSLWIQFPSNGTDIPRSAIVMFTYPSKWVYKTMKHLDSYLGSIKYYNANFQFGSENKFELPITVNNNVFKPFSFSDPTFGPQYASVNISVKNQPPDWAHYYSIDFSSRIKKGAYWHIVGLLYKDFFFGSDGYLRLKVNNIINYAHDINSFSNISTYTFEIGDRVCFQATGSFGNTGSPTPLILVADADFGVPNIDVEIKAMEWPSSDLQYAKDNASTPSYLTNSDGNKINDDSSSYIVISITFDMISNWTSLSNPAFLFEIYKPKKATKDQFYFPSVFLPIGNPGASNRYHVGVIQNQNPSNLSGVPAIVNCNPGDTYLKLRDCKYVYPCTDDNYSDYYTSNFIGIGRPNIYNVNAKRANYKSAMRYSELLIENTRINNLNKFQNNFTNLKSEFGGINFIHEVGDVLKILQDKKETSVYVGKEEITQANGETILRATNSVLGNINRMEEIRGTTHTKSVVVHNRNMYYWDGLRKEVIRSAPNGQEPISAYGMNTFFKNQTDYTDVIGGYDQQHDIYFISFIGGSSPVTVGFMEASLGNQNPHWCSFFSFVPNNYLSLGKNFFASFIGDNSLWKHNSTNVVRLNFYGVKYDQKINLIYNKNGAIKKLFKHMGIVSNKVWDVSTISIEADATYVRGFLSKIPKGRFTLKEGMFHSEYLKNMLSTSNTPSVLDLINGDDLRGLSIKHELVNSEDEECWLIGIEIGYDASSNY
jgi:hypothetical protein